MLAAYANYDKSLMVVDWLGDEFNFQFGSIFVPFVFLNENGSFLFLPNFNGQLVVLAVVRLRVLCHPAANIRVAAIDIHIQMIKNF